MESLSNDDGDGYENVTYKVNSRCFEHYRAYSISFSSSNLSIFFWSWILKYCSKVQEKKRKVVVFVHVLNKTWNWVFSRRGFAVMIEKCFKKRDGRAELLFFHSKPISFFFPFSLISPLSLLKHTDSWPASLQKQFQKKLRDTIRLQSPSRE